MSLPLHVSIPLVLLEKPRIDYKDKVHPNSLSSMKHIIVATEYLTKGAEAKAVRTNSVVNVANFLFE